MKKTSKNFLFCSFLDKTPNVAQFIQNGGRAKESYKGIGGDTNLRLNITNIRPDILIHYHQNNGFFFPTLQSHYSPSLLATHFSLYNKMAAQEPKTRKNGMRCTIISKIYWR
jgi:hypothetical protein